MIPTRSKTLEHIQKMHPEQYGKPDDSCWRLVAPLYHANAILEYMADVAKVITRKQFNKIVRKNGGTVKRIRNGSNYFYDHEFPSEQAVVNTIADLQPYVLAMDMIKDNLKW